jgi:hypothetical protein
MIAGDLTVADLPGAFNDGMKELLGLTLGEGRADTGMRGAGGLEELRGGQCPESIGREVTEAAARPVDVLKAAVPVVGHGVPVSARPSPRAIFRSCAAGCGRTSMPARA